MAKPIISVEGLGKSYLVGHQSSGREQYTALRDVLGRTVKDFGRKALDMACGRQIIQGDEVEEFWALKDVSFEVNEGEVVGIIGRNGAGKSTLLKVLSRITEPTKGKVTLRGRVASLLEVGTGFHPELSGRENIFLNGAILGMTRTEIKKKFDEIVDFAGVEKFLDTPVKRYSSGMYVRLAFAVAAHLEPEILVVDEVLAVGDSGFQKKCIGKMKDVADNGRTVLFVSHNMTAIRSLCDRGLFLSGGELAFDGSVEDSLEGYASSQFSGTSQLFELQGSLSSVVSLDCMQINGIPVVSRSRVVDSRKIDLQFQVQITDANKYVFAIAVFFQGLRLFTIQKDPHFFPEGKQELLFSIPSELLRKGEFVVGFGCADPADRSRWAWSDEIVGLDIENNVNSSDQQHFGVINANA